MKKSFLKILGFLFAFSIVLTSGAAFADYNTTANTVVTPLSVSINYSAGSTTISVSSTTGNAASQVTVTANGGILFVTSPLITSAIDAAPGSVNIVTYALTNTGNASDQITVTNSAAVQEGAISIGSAWNVSFNQISIIASAKAQVPGAQTVLTVTPSVDASDGATASVTVNARAFTAGRIYGQYTGDNTSIYGATSNVTINVKFKIKSPVLVATKNATIIAPTTYVTNGGSATDPVPGARIVYAIRVQNIGSGPSNVVEIIDRIPTANTDFLISSVTSNVASTITCSNDNGASFANTCSTGSGVSPNITHVKFVLSSPLTAGSSATVTFNAVIE